MSNTNTDTKTNSSLPFQPLWDMAAAMAGANGPVGPQFTALDFASRVGHNVKAVTRWSKQGEIPWLSADRAAIEMGVHPMAVWGLDWLDVKGDYHEIANGDFDAVIDKALKKVVIKVEDDVVQNLADEGLEWPEDTAEWIIAHDIAKSAVEAGLLDHDIPSLERLMDTHPEGVEFVSLEDAGIID